MTPNVSREELVLGVELGHGYFGAVHRGVWRQGTEVAVKTLRHKEGRQEADFEREKATFLAETEVMKRLNHPHLVKMLGICVEKSPFYLVQELCQNGDLKHYLKSFDFIKVGTFRTSPTVDFKTNILLLRSTNPCHTIISKTTRRRTNSRTCHP